MPCTDLVLADPDYSRYCNSLEMSAGGVWFGIKKPLPPIIWRITFPLDIQQAIVSESNRMGQLTNSNLEMAGMLCQWLVLEVMAEVAHIHIAIGCDNTPTVAWSSHLLAMTAPIATHLLRALALQMLAGEASPLATLHIPGEMNHMVDIASQSAVSHPDNQTFLTHFNSMFHYCRTHLGQCATYTTQPVEKST